MDYRLSDYGNVLVYTLNGYLKGQPEGYALLEVVRGKIATGTPKIVLDMTGVDRIDSSGIGVVAAMVGSAEKAQATILFAAITPRVLQSLQIVHLTQAMRTFPSLEAALASLAR